MAWVAPVISGVAGLIGGWLGGRGKSNSNAQIIQKDVRTPEQKALQEQMAGIYGQQLEGIQSGSALQDALAQGKQDFSNYTLPGIQQSYAGPGTFWGSDRAQAETQGRNQFMDSIRMQEQQRQQQVMQGAMGLSGMPTQFMHGVPPQEPLMNSLVKGLPSALTAYLMSR